MASQLGISQATVSKYESMQLEPSASDWYNFCQIVGIDSHKTIELGYIDGKTKFKQRLHSESLFHVPLKYRGDFLMKIREMIPIKNAFIEQVGEEEWLNMLREKGLSPEIFYIFDFQLSLSFLFDVVSEARQMGIDLWISSLKFAANDHGIFNEDYLKKKTSNDLLEAIVKNQPFYQRALDVEYIQQDEILCILRPSDTSLEFFERDVIQDYMRYKSNSFKSILKSNSFYPRIITEEIPGQISLSIAG